MSYLGIQQPVLPRIFSEWEKRCGKPGVFGVPVLLIFGFLCYLWGESLPAEDVIRLADGSCLTGTVESVTAADGIALKQTDGKTVFVPCTQMKRIETERTMSHQQGDELFDQGLSSSDSGKLRQALELYQKARKSDEKRIWVRQWLTWKIVRCHAALGQDAEAGAEFLVLCQTDSFLPPIYLSSIPLVWTSDFSRLSDPRQKQLEQLAVSWLDIETKSKTPKPGETNPEREVSGNTKSNPAGKLLAASLLLDSQTYREKALQTLQTLVLYESPDPDSADLNEFARSVSLLATTQLWRLKARQRPSESEVDFWRQTVERLPGELQVGPFLLVGKGYQGLELPSKAVPVLLRAALLSSDRKTVAQSAFSLSIEILKRQGQTEEAFRLEQEFLRKFPK